MSFSAYSVMSPWAASLVLLAHFVAGIALGVVYFRALRWNAEWFAAGDHIFLSIALMIGRFALLGGLLALASLEGAIPLLMMAAGVLMARRWVVRRAIEAMP